MIIATFENGANREKKGNSLLVNSDPRRIRLYTVLC